MGQLREERKGTRGQKRRKERTQEGEEEKAEQERPDKPRGKKNDREIFHFCKNKSVAIYFISILYDSDYQRVVEVVKMPFPSAKRKKSSILRELHCYFIEVYIWP